MISQYQIIQRNVECAVGGGKIYVIFIKGFKKVWCGYVCCGSFKVKLVTKRCIFNYSNFRGFTSITLLAFLPLDTLFASITFFTLFALRTGVSFFPLNTLDTLFASVPFVALFALWTGVSFFPLDTLLTSIAFVPFLSFLSFFPLDTPAHQYRLYLPSRPAAQCPLYPL